MYGDGERMGREEYREGMVVRLNRGGD